MNNIAKKYFSKSSHRSALLFLRKWVSEIGIYRMCAIFGEAYHSANEEDRAHIGKIISALFEIERPAMAKECAERFGVTIDKHFSIGENLVIDAFDGQDRLIWRKGLCKACNSQTSTFDKSQYPMVVDHGDVVQLSEKDRIFACRTQSGCLRILCIELNNQDILIDEESFGESPLYFTESTHYVSPVFRVTIMRKIIEYIMKMTGYPSIPMDCVAVFNRQGANLINMDEYLPGGEHEDAWENVRVLTRREFPNDYFFTDVISWNNNEALLFQRLLIRFQRILRAASILYAYMSDHDKLINMTENSLRKACMAIKLFDISPESKCDEF